jgi:predicted phosphodiesterase
VAYARETMNPRFRDLLRSPLARRTALDAAAVVLAVVAGVLAFSAAAQGRLDVGPARLVISVVPATAGQTVVELPPFGAVSAPTHAGPVRLDVRLEEIDIVGAARFARGRALSVPATLGPDAVEILPVTGLSALLWRMLGGGALAAALAGLVVALALRRKRLVVAIAVALAVAVPGIAVGVAYGTWNVSAFREPTLRGNLAYAPQLVDIFSTRVANIRRLRDEAAVLASNLAAYYADDRSLASGGAMPGTFRVLHITDQHLDAVGAELARSISRSYETSLVIDTGDLPISGINVETSVFASLVDTTVPHVYVPGNHDSPASIAAVKQLGVRVLATGMTEVRGLRIFSVRDPTSYGFSLEPDPAPIEAAARSAFAQMQALMRSGEATPDIVAVHNPLMQAPFIGFVPLIVSGHTHAASFSVQRGTVLLNSGTLGGISYDPEANARDPLPYSASVLYFTAELPRRLIAIDRISVYPQRSTTVTRELIDESLMR